ncbi:MAG TPA: ABC transporter permease subunit, partial [Acidimicrobiia bacterium]|nr:ABC transporter permease subunit [Acidimicrobiia bacterium]
MAEPPPIKRRGWVRGWLSAVYAQPASKLGLGLIALFALAAVAHPILFATIWPRAIYDPRAGFDLNTIHPAPLSWSHPLGTDAFGKDVLSMLIAGTAPSLTAAVAAALAAGLVSISVASVVASYKRTGRVLNVITDGALFIPIPAVMLILGADPRADRLTPLVFGLLFGTLTGLSSGAMVLRSQALPLIRAEYVEAARVAGASGLQIISRHLVPSLLPLAGVYAVIGAGGAIVTQGFLAWLAYTAAKSDWGTLIYWALTTQLVSGGLQWNIIIAG